MSHRRLVDTNLIVRFLVQDHLQHSAIAAKIFDSCARGDLTPVSLPTVLAECVFVLESFYKHPRSEIARVLSDLISSRGIELADGETHRDALARYSTSKLHFVDCLIATSAATAEIPVATLDREFRKFTDVQVNLD
ncbi:MAG: PIN domain-containing protein [Planctomycetes bacterium]|nr:PIN domain-containing protein [Planctomycetota bacterium]